MVDKEAEHLIIKAHYPDLLMTELISKKAFFCICSIRNPEDAIASWMRMFDRDLKSSVLVIKNWLRWYQPVKKNVLQIDYETIDLYPLYAILIIQKYLLGRWNLLEAFLFWRKYNKKRLKKFSDNLRVSEKTKKAVDSYYDSETLLHRRHISSIKSRPAKLELSEEQIIFIRTNLEGLWP
jgi:hypothetical protein